MVSTRHHRPLIERLDASVRSMAGHRRRHGRPPARASRASVGTGRMGRWQGWPCWRPLMSVVWAPTPPAVDHPLEVSRHQGEMAWVAFDVDDEAHVLVVVSVARLLSLCSMPAVPCRRFRWRPATAPIACTRGQAVLVASSSHAFEDVVKLLAHAQEDRAPLSALAASIRRAQPTSDVWTYVL